MTDTVTIRYSDLVKFCKQCTPKGFEPRFKPYGWIAVWEALTRKKRWPTHQHSALLTQAEKFLKKEGVELPLDVQGTRIYRYHTRYLISE